MGISKARVYANLKAPREYWGYKNLKKVQLGEATRRQKVTPRPPCYDVMKRVIPSLLFFVVLKYHGKTESLFAENPAPVWCFLTGISVYWLIVGQMKRMETVKGECFRVLNRAALASVVFTFVSLTSIFLPPRVTFVPLMVLTPLPVLLLVQPILHRVYTQVRPGIASFIDRVRAKLASSETSLPYVILREEKFCA